MSTPPKLADRQFRLLQLIKRAKDIHAIATKLKELFAAIPVSAEFFDLPLELRDLIYHDYLIEDNWNRKGSTFKSSRHRPRSRGAFYTPSLLLVNKQIAREAALVLQKIPYVVCDRFDWPHFIDDFPTIGHETMLHLQHVELVFKKDVNVGNIWRFSPLILAISQPSSEIKSLIVLTRCVAKDAEAYEIGWKFGPNAKHRMRHLLYPGGALLKSILDLNYQLSVELLTGAIGKEEGDANGKASGMEK